MKQLYSACNALEAHGLRLFLESRGISATVIGDNSPLETGFSFTPESGPCVFVAAEDFEQGTASLQEYLDSVNDRPTLGIWKCAKCGQLVEGQFDTCWKCESPRGDAPAIDVIRATAPIHQHIADAPTPEIADTSDVSPPIELESKRDAWLEVGVMLCVAWLPHFVNSAIILWLPPTPRNLPYAAEMSWWIITNLMQDVVVLYIMYRSILPWQAYGIVRPRVGVDIGVAMLIWMIATFAVGMVYSFVATFAGRDATLNFMESGYEFAAPARSADLLFLVAFAISNGFSEELAMRGYFIPRFERLLNSGWKSVVITAVLFASYHTYQGFGAIIPIFVVGIVLGIAFCLTRRLWPVVIAHSGMDVLASWPTA
jgi:membrane protease YdiL (CAAX protease family)